MSDPLIRKIATKILTKEAANGHTTLADASAACMTAVRSEKVSKALILVALHDLFRREITHQLKSLMSPGVGIRALPKVPPEIIRRLPQWFSTGEGPGAMWVPSPVATLEQIRASRDLRHRKADQTIAQAEFLDQLLDYLIAMGCDSLSDV